MNPEEEPNEELKSGGMVKPEVPAPPDPIPFEGLKDYRSGWR